MRSQIRLQKRFAWKSIRLTNGDYIRFRHYYAIQRYGQTIHKLNGRGITDFYDVALALTLKEVKRLYKQDRLERRDIMGYINKIMKSIKYV